jgi:uncharacterized membrane protein
MACRPASALVSLLTLLVFPISTVLGGTRPLDCAVKQYTVVALPFKPASINEAGQIAGTTAEHRAAVWSRKYGLRSFVVPVGFDSSEATAINGAGHVAGTAYDRGLTKHQALRIANDVVTVLSGVQSRAYAISDSDAVAGESMVLAKPNVEAVVWEEGLMRAMGECCGGAASGVNSNGDVIGRIYDEQGRFRAFLWTRADGLKRIGPPNRYSSAIAINKRGRIIVAAFPEVYLYSTGNLNRLVLSPKYPSQARAINDCDVIVGSYGPYADAARAFVWEESVGFRDLNSLISADSGWKLEKAVGINDRGEIVGTGDSRGTEDSGYLLIPKE